MKKVPAKCSRERECQIRYTISIVAFELGDSIFRNWLQLEKAFSLLSNVVIYAVVACVRLCVRTPVHSMYFATENLLFVW